jgi:hypothetical protein
VRDVKLLPALHLVHLSKTRTLLHLVPKTYLVRLRSYLNHFSISVFA